MYIKQKKRIIRTSMDLCICLPILITSFGAFLPLNFGWPTVYPKGTTIYTPERCYNGYTLLSIEVGPPEAILIDMNGRVVNKWKVEAERVKLLRNGHLLAGTKGKPRKIQEYDWNGNLYWEFEAEGPAHHDFQRLKDGNTLLIYREEVPREYLKKSKFKERGQAKRILSDVIIEVTPDKKVIWEWHEYKHFDIDWYNPAVSIIDWTHTNTIQALPENKWFDNGDERFKPGNILISPRCLDAILIINKESKKIVWKYTGGYNGGLSGQHEPHMIEKGLPGAGNIVVFDNGASPTNLAHAGESYVLEINPITEEIVWKYENGEKFFSKYRCTVQRFPNGNTLICEADACRIFEVTNECEIVWEYTIEFPSRIVRAYRYPYDYCPETEVLVKGDEVPIKPPPGTPLFPIEERGKPLGEQKIEMFEGGLIEHIR